MNTLDFFEQAILSLGFPLGLWISFRILRYPDLALETTSIIGAFILAKTIKNEDSLIWIPLLIIIGSSVIALLSTFLKSTLKVHPVLVSLIISYIAYSLSLAYLGSGNLFFRSVAADSFAKCSAFIALVTFTILTLLFHKVLSTKQGLKVIAVGCNFDLAQQHSLGHFFSCWVGLTVSNILLMTSGAFLAFRSGYADIGMFQGMLLVSIFCVITTSILNKRIKLGINSIVLLVVASVYFLVLKIVILQGVEPFWIRAIIALGLVLVLAAARFLAKDLRLSWIKL